MNSTFYTSIIFDLGHNTCMNECICILHDKEFRNPINIFRVYFQMENMTNQYGGKYVGWRLRKIVSFRKPFFEEFDLHYERPKQYFVEQIIPKEKVEIACEYLMFGHSNLIKSILSKTVQGIQEEEPNKFSKCLGLPEKFEIDFEKLNLRQCSEPCYKSVPGYCTTG